MLVAIASVAVSKPSVAIKDTRSGAKSAPRTLAPLSARLKAFGLSRSNQRETIALIAAALIAVYPAPVRSAAGNICHVCCAFAQATMPSPVKTAPALVTRPMPKRRCITGRLTTTRALNRKWSVIAAEIVERDKPRAAWDGIRFSSVETSIARSH
jgi:hypothetical protein